MGKSRRKQQDTNNYLQPELDLGRIVMDKKIFYRNIFWYEMLLNVLLWIVYDPERAFFGVYTWVGIVLFLLIGVPAILYVALNRVKQP